MMVDRHPHVSRLCCLTVLHWGWVCLWAAREGQVNEPVSCASISTTLPSWAAQKGHSENTHSVYPVCCHHNLLTVCLCCLLGFLRHHRWNDRLCIKYVWLTWVKENDNCVPSRLAQQVTREQRIKVLHHGETLDRTTTQHLSTGRCSPKESRILSKELDPISVRAKTGIHTLLSPTYKKEQNPIKR